MTQDPIFQRRFQIDKKEVIREFKEHILPNIPVGDWPGLREAFNNYVDELQKNGRITERLASSIVYDPTTWPTVTVKIGKL
jgi:hypothetical protein